MTLEMHNGNGLGPMYTISSISMHKILARFVWLRNVLLVRFVCRLHRASQLDCQDISLGKEKKEMKRKNVNGVCKWRRVRGIHKG